MAAFTFPHSDINRHSIFSYFIKIFIIIILFLQAGIIPPPMLWREEMSSRRHCRHWNHYTDVIMSAMASQTTSLTIVYSTVYSGADQREHQSSSSLAFVREIPVNFPQNRPATQEMFTFDDVIMRRPLAQLWRSPVHLSTLTYLSMWLPMPQCTKHLIVCCDAFYYLLISQIASAAFVLFQLLQYYYHNEL